MLSPTSCCYESTERMSFSITCSRDAMAVALRISGRRMALNGSQHEVPEARMILERKLHMEWRRQRLA